jgi:hypothetical protein
MNKKIKKVENKLLPVHIYGIWDVKEKKLIYITLNEEDAEFEMLLKDVEKYSLGEFDIYLDAKGC